ncbi:hypothetical protein Plhal703r1_c09g0049851 [Plasmopara halstedii]
MQRFQAHLLVVILLVAIAEIASCNNLRAETGTTPIGKHFENGEDRNEERMVGAVKEGARLSLFGKIKMHFVNKKIETALSKAGAMGIKDTRIKTMQENPKFMEVFQRAEKLLGPESAKLSTMNIIVKVFGKESAKSLCTARNWICPTFLAKSS